MKAITPTSLALLALAIAAALPAQSSEPDERFTRVSTDARLRNCPERVALLLQGEPERAVRDARALSDAIRRPVFALRNTEDASVGTLRAHLRAWIAEQRELGKHIDVVAHGDGVALAAAALGSGSMEGRALYVLAHAPILGLPTQNTRLVTRERVVAHREQPSAAPTTKDAERFDAYLARFHNDAYGKALDPLLRSPEKTRSPVPRALVEFRMVASEDYAGRPGRPLRARFDLALEKRRLDAWLDQKKNAQRVAADPALIRRFNQRTREAGGPAHWHLAWYPARSSRLAQFHRGFLPINMHELGFTERELELDSLRLARGPLGDYVFEYAMRAKHARAYSDMTARSAGSLNAIAVRGVVRMTPKIIGRVPGRGQITGALSRDEIHATIAAIRSQDAARRRARDKARERKD